MREECSFAKDCVEGARYEPPFLFVQGSRKHNQKASISDRSLAKGSGSGKDKYQRKHADREAFLEHLVLVDSIYILFFPRFGLL
jgi:hypothetical protein